MTAEGPTTSSGSRIPIALQAVFLASNRGNEVDIPPPGKVASKTYFRRTLKGIGKKLKRVGSGTKKSSKKNRTDGEPSTNNQHETKKSKKDSEETNSTANSTQQLDSKQRKSKQEKPSLPARPPMSPQAYLDVLIHSRGYSTRRYRTLQTGYYSKPTAFQQASYNVHLVKLVRDRDIHGLRSLMKAGISQNPCNAYGESLVHMVCRRGDHDLLEMMLMEVGTTIQVSDDYGRTPLHDACWAAQPSFETVELIGDRDVALFHMTDSRGAVPLSYVRREHWPQWIDFLESKKDDWWPPKAEEDEPGPLIDVGPNELPVPDPPNALSIELASMVASGVMSPEEAILLKDDEYDYDDDDSSYSSSSSEESDDDSLDDSAEQDVLEGFSLQEQANMLSRVEFSKQRFQ